ncbi:TRAP transporter substrate-binding protein DctP [Antarcticimicrobium luteum]|uniref:C4-dicarboxylate ABC transporter substrate-binding protein n=1 Tax=Antarcticimicrobium luteum TaxID=2547397 RepID=A0A4R5UX07_9RHOB|nr:TRAP transporter substrate-binding protein DctP [Antarcticimicrobium luteum]TDK43843.1 hypothetical protein E1832_16345 [Antarcticimicrobium luteum]
MGLRDWALAATLAATALTAQAAEVEWTLGSAVGPQDPTTLNYQELARRVAEASGGRFEIEVIPIETIGFKNVDSLRVVKQGAVDAMGLVPYYVTRDEPAMGVFAPHGMLVEAEENLKIVDTQYEIAREILSGDKWGMELIARAPFGALRDMVIMTKEPINTLDGLRGIKFRHFTKDGLKAFNALGISTQVVPSSELYLALKTGVVDGSVYGPTYAKSQSIYEVTCCYSYLGAFSMAYPFSIVAQKETWAAVPEDLQEIFVTEARVMWDEALERWRSAETEKAAYDWLKTQGGMRELDPMPLEDRKEIQAELIKIWKGTCAGLGEQAVSYCTRIEAALTN